MTEWDPDGSSVLVAGATGGLGSRIAGRLAARGAKLTLVSRSKERLEDLDVAGAHAAADLRRPGAADEVVEVAVAAHGGIDAVVNATGIVAFGPLADLDTDTLEELFLVNTFLPVMLMQAALRRFDDAGLLVNLSAIVAEQPTANMAAYSASKAALSAVAAAVRSEVRRSGVRILDVRPPHTETGLAERPIAGKAPKLPDGKDPDDVAERVVAAMLTGERDLGPGDF